MNKLLIFGVLGLMLVSCICVVVISDDSNDSKISNDELRELNRVNEILGVNPSDLANPRSREVSQQAKDFVTEERLNKIEEVKTE